MVKRNETVRYLFTEKFGRPIEEFNTIKNATETLSEVTKTNYSKNLSRFFLWLGEDPDQVIANRKIQRKADDETTDYYERKVRAYKKHLEETQTGRGTQGQIGRIQGFFKNNSKHFSLDLGNMKYNKERKTAKYSPDNAMCREIYSFADCARDRLIVALGCQNGLSPKDTAKIKWHKIPAEPFKYYEASRSKNGEVRHGVTTPEIIQEFAAYKKIRGEPTSKDEPLFKSREGFLNSAGISQVISTLIKKAGYDNIAGLMPKSLRDSFEDALVDAEIPGKVKEAMMGHVCDIEHQYGGQKRLEARLEECMQKAYKFLMLTKNNNTNGTAKQQFDILQTENTQIKAQLEKQTQDFLNFKQEVFAVIQSIKQDFSKVDSNEKETETPPTESTNTP